MKVRFAMNNRLRYFLTPLVFIVFVFVAASMVYPRQQAVGKSQGSIAGRVTSAQKPISGIAIKLIRPAQLGQPRPTEIAAVATDNTGFYHFDGVPAGTYDVIPGNTVYVVSDLT